MNEMFKATVIIPTTGANTVVQAIQSVLDQTIPTCCYIVVDGMNHSVKVAKLVNVGTMHYNPRFRVCTIPDNVGANGFYGHRIYAAFTHLVNTEYVLYLDQDNWFDKNHVESCINKIESNKLQWAYSLRKIHDVDGNYLCNDNCESLGKWPTYHGVNHVDTSSFCIRTDVANKVASVWHGGWGQDRVFYQALSEHFKQYDGTGEYTLNYSVAGNQGSDTKEFFEYGNKVMGDKYNGEFPWAKRKV